MKTTFLSTGYCELLHNAISGMFPIGCMMDDVRYEHGASIFQIPTTVLISDESLDPTLSDSLGNANLALFGLMVSNSPEQRDDQRTVLIGFSLVIELYEDAEDCYICEPGDLVRQFRDQSGTEGYYNLTLAAYALGNAEQHRTLSVSSSFILPAYEIIAGTIEDSDVISAFFGLIGDSEWITCHMSEYVRSLAALEAHN